MNKVRKVHYPQKTVFNKGSVTFYNSSRIFPARIRRDVFALYGFVRTADNFVDNQPQDEHGFIKFCREWEQAEQGEETGNIIVNDFVSMSRRLNFDRSWTVAFLETMASDLNHKPCDSLEDALVYTYGSAEVIGLFMNRIMEAPDSGFPHARLFGRALQYINFIRDIAEDESLGRRYLPLGNSGLTGLSEQEAQSKPEIFRQWFLTHTELYKSWYMLSSRGFSGLSRRCLLPVSTAGSLYLWTARTLEKDPLRVYREKVKPSKSRILLQFLFNSVFPGKGLSRSKDALDPGKIPGGMAIPRYHTKRTGISI